MNVLKTLLRPNIYSLRPYSSARSEFEGVAEIYLDANENPYETGLNRYPDPLQRQVKERISVLMDCSISNIFLGNGSDEVIDLLIRMFCEPRQDHIITLPPTYGMYRVSADIADVAVKEIPLDEHFKPEVESILETADRHSKILFLCSPNNPTGNDLEPEAVRSLLDNFPGIIVIDEAYYDFSDHPGYIGLIGEYPKLVVMRTFSKAWGLAGIRLGMAFASEELIGIFNKVKPPYNINQLTQQAVVFALDNAETKAEWVSVIRKERKRLETALNSIGFIQKVYPSDANFLLVKMRQPDRVYELLMQQKIIVRNRSKVRGCEGCLRFTIGQPTENEHLLFALKEIEKIGII